jgi:hypothetical protein
MRDLGFHSASIAPEAVDWSGKEMALQSQAQHRTRTDDPFLTIGKRDHAAEGRLRVSAGRTALLALAADGCLFDPGS